VPHWYASLFSMINPLNAKDITAMFKQQLRWNLDFLDEIKPFDKSLLQR